MGNRLIEKDKKKKINPMATAGMPDDNIENKDEIATEKENIENIIEDTKTEEKQKEGITETIPSKDQSIETKKESIKVPKSDVMDLFIVKKKEKIRKRQKNLWLKEENIDTLEDIAKKTGYNEGELVDILIENYLKLLKMK